MQRLALQSTLAVGVLVICCCAIGPQSVAQSVPPPPTPPSSPTVVELPKDNEKAVPQDGKEGWTKVTASDRTQDEGKYPKSKYIKVSLKKNKKGGEAVQQTEQLRIKKIGYYKKPGGEYVEVDVTSTQSAKGDESQITIPADADLSKPIFVKVFTVNVTGEGEEEVIPANPPINKNFAMLYSGGDKVVSIGTGGGTLVSVDGEDETNLIDMAQSLGLSDDDYEQPDLMFWCTDLIETGVILFTPLGQFQFSSVPEAIHVFDANGSNLVANGAITLADAYLTPRGDLAVPVGEIDAAVLPAFGMIVRGVSLTLDDAADANTVHCYCVGGSSLRFLEGDVCPIVQGTRVLDNWELLTWSASYALGTATATIGEESVVIGAPFIDLVSGTGNSGYLDGIVIEGSTNNAIKNGKIVLRPVSDWQFGLVEGEASTKVYVLNANTGADLYDEEISASVGLSSFGDLVVTLNNIEAHCASVRIKVVITGLRAAYNAPVPWGVGYKVECFGAALRAPLRLPRVFFEGESPDASEPSGPLAQEPIAVTGWTPVATSP